jgi:hypothetical protein
MVPVCVRPAARAPTLLLRFGVAADWQQPCRSRHGGLGGRFSVSSNLRGGRVPIMGVGLPVSRGNVKRRIIRESGKSIPFAQRANWILANCIHCKRDIIPRRPESCAGGREGGLPRGCRGAAIPAGCRRGAR